MATPHTILVTDPIHPAGIELLQQQEGIVVDVQENISPADFESCIGNYEGILVRARTKITAKLLAQAKNLKVIGRVGIDVTTIDVEAASRQGILVVNSPRGSVVSTAEHTLGLIFALARHTLPAHQALLEKNWQREHFEGIELANKTLGIIGLGKTGSEVAWRARACGMQIVAYDPYVHQEYADKRYANLVSLEQLLTNADIVTLHAPVTQITRHLINEQTIATMGKGTLLINCALAELVDSQAVVDALRSGSLGGAALDALDRDEIQAGIFQNAPNLILTPSISGDTHAAKRKSTLDVCQGVLDVLKGKSPQFPVNLPAPMPKDMEYYKPFLALARRLGSFARQLTKGAVGSISFTFAGDIAKKQTDLLKVEFLLAFLKAGSNRQDLNLINVFYAAKEEGIHCTDEKINDNNNFASLVTVHLTSDSEEHTVSGTVMRGEPHLVQIDRYWVDVVPAGHMILTSHRDQPGIIGLLGTCLGEHGINIAVMEVGRSAPGQDALMVVIVDTPPPPSAIAQLSASEKIFSIKTLNIEAV